MPAHRFVTFHKTSSEIEASKLPRQAKEILFWLSTKYETGKEVPMPDVMLGLNANQNNVLSIPSTSPLSRILDNHRQKLINEGYMSVSVVKTGVAAKAPSKAAILKAYVSTLEGLCVANGIAYERPAELDEAASSEASDTATDTTAAAA